MTKDRLLVTGATGLVGANACRQALEAGQPVRALVRRREDAGPLEELGAEVALGDVTDRVSLDAAMEGVDFVLHCAALIGGSWTPWTDEQFMAVNRDGAIAVLDAAAHKGVRRTTMISSIAVLWPEHTVTEMTPHTPISSGDSPYLESKRAAYLEGLARAARGQEIMTVFPGCIYGPTLFEDRALQPTCFNASLIEGATGKLTSYLSMPMSWVLADDVAKVALAALDRGERGRNYLAMGDNREALSLVDFCNRFNALIGSPRRLTNYDPATDPEGPARFGSINRYSERQHPTPLFDATATNASLGIEPVGVDNGLALTVEWLSRIGRLPSAGQLSGENA